MTDTVRTTQTPTRPHADIDGMDLLALAMGTVMMLGPLVAMAVLRGTY